MMVTWAPPLSSILRRRSVRLRWGLIARIISRLGRWGIRLLGGWRLAIVTPWVPWMWRGELAVSLWRGGLAIRLWRRGLTVPLWRVGLLGWGMSIRIGLVA